VPAPPLAVRIFAFALFACAVQLVACRYLAPGAIEFALDAALKPSCPAGYMKLSELKRLKPGTPSDMEQVHYEEEACNDGFAEPDPAQMQFELSTALAVYDAALRYREAAFAAGWVHDSRSTYDQELKTDSRGVASFAVVRETGAGYMLLRVTVYSAAAIESFGYVDDGRGAVQRSGEATGVSVLIRAPSQPEPGAE
jgi:hypothetical protein